MTHTESELESAFGPLDVAGVLAADESRGPWREGRDVLDSCGVGAACVPAELGGGWCDSYELMRLLRPVFRRDVTAGLWLVTGVVRPVLSAPEVAAPVLAGQAVAYADDRLPIRAPVVVANAAGASVLVGAVGGRVTVHDAVPGGLRPLTLSACRGLDLAVADALPDGRAGRPHDEWSRLAGAALAAGGAVGTLDTCLRLATDFAVRRRLYGTVAADLPHARGLLAGAYADLLAADVLSRAAGAAIDERSSPAAMVHLIPRLLAAAARDLATVLGARFYLRRGPYALFGKCVRDLAMVRILCGEPGSPDVEACRAIVRGADSPWSRAALTRWDTVDREARPPLTEDLADALLPDLVDRTTDGFSCDTNAVPLARHAGPTEE